MSGSRADRESLRRSLAFVPFRVRDQPVLHDHLFIAQKRELAIELLVARIWNSVCLSLQRHCCNCLAGVWSWLLFMVLSVRHFNAKEVINGFVGVF